MPLALARLLLRLVHCLHDELESVTPAHERLRRDVLVVLGEVQAATQQFKASPAVVPRRQAELGLEGGAEQRAAVLAEPVSLDLDSARRPLERLDQGDGDPQVFGPQGPYRL